MFLKYYMQKSATHIENLPPPMGSSHKTHPASFMCSVDTCIHFYFYFLHKHLLGVKVHSNKFCGILMPTDCSVWIQCTGHVFHQPWPDFEGLQIRTNLILVVAKIAQFQWTQIFQGSAADSGEKHSTAPAQTPNTTLNRYTSHQWNEISLPHELT